MEATLSRHRIEIYDTTLRDGAQGEGIFFTPTAKIETVRLLDELGVDFIEGGWPFANRKDTEFFKLTTSMNLQHARLCAFGRTRHKDTRAEVDPQLWALVHAQTAVVTIFGKSWEPHVRQALGTTPEHNLEIIGDSVEFLHRHVSFIVYDAEHFFDGYKADPNYALECLKSAQTAGADRLVLCDTNGGTLPEELATIVRAVRAALPDAVLGIHTHNDSECAVANALLAVSAGAVHVQGTMNGFGERCGNCNLIPVAASLRLKLGYDCLLPESLGRLTLLAENVDRITGMLSDSRRAYVGRSAFAHKGGVHVHGDQKGASYQHIEPEVVGNKKRILISEQAGGTSIVAKARELGFPDVPREDARVAQLLDSVVAHELQGYSYEEADGSLRLLLESVLREQPTPFLVKQFRCIVMSATASRPRVTEATVKIEVGGVQEMTVAEGTGPVHALDNALRKALMPAYPMVTKIRLRDFFVRVIHVDTEGFDPEKGTAAKVRVIISSTDGEQIWNTVGVSTDMVEASWEALIESYIYGIRYGVVL